MCNSLYLLIGPAGGGGGGGGYYGGGGSGSETSGDAGGGGGGGSSLVPAGGVAFEGYRTGDGAVYLSFQLETDPNAVSP